MLALNRLLDFIKEHALFLPEERVLLAVSGGRDSVLMAHLFKAAGFNFGIAHCNFNMRAEESADDETFTSALAAELDVPFFATNFDTREYASLHHISIQMAARDLRYQWLEEIRNDFGFQYIGLAHHQNDVMETMLLNLTRGTGISGMHGILPKNNKLIRPLLFLTREEITDIFNQTALSYREDSSNLSTKYARNKIRLEVIPVLKKLNPGLEQTFEANRKRFAELEIIYEQRIAQLHSELFRMINEDEYEIGLPNLQQLNPLDTLLYGLFHPFGFTEAVLHNLSESWGGRPGKVFNSSTHQIILDRKQIILSKIKQQQPAEMNIEVSSSQISWNGQKFGVRIIPVNEFLLRKDAEVAQLDMDLLEFPLTLRVWKKGDHFYPLGMKGKKKLSDFFIEHKIPLNRKKDIGILQNKNGHVLWIAGFRIDERYKINRNTKKVFIFEQFI